jgi:cytoskeletal protein CcmA (bactofilin family)
MEPMASTIGRGTLVRGSVHGEGDLEILGRVEGSVSVSGDLAVGETALIKSDVSGRHVTVRGAIAGNVSATGSIVLEAGARVVGDLGAPQIGIRPGALVRGMVSTGGPLAAAASSGSAATTRARPAAAPPRSSAAPARPAVDVGGLTRGQPALPKPLVPSPVRAAAKPAAPAAPARPRAESPTLASARVEASHDGASAPNLPLKAPPARAADVASADAMDAGARHTHAHARAHDEVVSLGEPEKHGGPPPPVVPSIRKGAKASLRRKSGR